MKFTRYIRRLFVNRLRRQAPAAKAVRWLSAGIFVLCLLALAGLGLGLWQAQAQGRGRRANTPPVRATRSQTNPAPFQDTRVTNTEQVAPKTGTVGAKVVTGPATTVPPNLTQEQREQRERMMEQREGEVPYPITVVPAQSVVPSADAPSPLPRAVGGPTNAPQAPNDFVTRSQHDLTAAEAPLSERSVIQEPSLGVLGGTLFYTANWYAARSVDGGQTFTYVNPYTNFPSVNNGFCCDQLATSVPAQNMMVWALQYNNDANTGTLRIARAIGSQVATNTWTYYDFTPQFFGFANGNWMDFPNLTVSSNFLYGSSNVFSTNCPGGNCPFTGAVVFRIPLTELAAGGTVNVSWFTRTDTGSLRCTEGATTTMYCGSARTNTSTRIFTWPDAGNIVFDDVTINSYVRLNRDGVATSPDGSNWAARADSRVLGAWLRGGTMGFMWGARQNGGTRPYPYVIVAQFNAGNRAFVSQGDIWNDQFAFLYPQASVNAAGNLGGALSFGGGGLYPNAAAWVVDDVTPSITPLTGAFTVTEGNRGPDGNDWGDYMTTRRHSSDTNTYVAAIFAMRDGGDGADTRPRYLRFGRERDFAVCGYSLSSASAGASAGGGTGFFSVLTGTSCNWTAASNTNWLSVFAGATGSGTNFVDYSYGSNPTFARSGTITAGGQTFTVNQAASPACLTSTPISPGQTLNGVLSGSDCQYSDGSLLDRYTFTGAAGQQVAITMNSSAVNAYLFLLNPAGAVIASDNDGGGGTNARIPAGTGFLTLPSAGTYTIYANTLAAGQSGAYTVSLFQPCPTITVNPTGLSNGTVGVIYSQTFTATGGTPAYGFSVSAGALPGGLTLNPSSGVLSGTPTAQNSFAFTIRATDLNGCFGERGYTVTIAGNGLMYYPLPRPIRLFDTRAPIAGFPACAYLSQPLPGNVEFVRQARITCDGITIPASAKAIVGNATVVNPQGGGFAILFPNGQARPTASNINFTAGQVIANSFTIGLGDDGQFRIYPFVTTDFIVDITGYFAPPGAGGLYYHPLPRPIRLFDTRAPIAGFPACAYLNQPLPGNVEFVRQARITCDSITIPGDAQVIVGNSTVVNPQGGGFATLFPNGQARPTASNINYVSGQVIANAFTVGLGSDGQFRIYPFTTTDFIVDITGYYSSSSVDVNGTGLLYETLPRPIRLFDTRAPIAGFPACAYLSQPLPGNVEFVRQARITCDSITVPAAAEAITGNSTVVNPVSGGFATLFPNGQARPTASNINYAAGQVIANAFTLRLGGDGQFRIYPFTTTDFVVDITGYFRP